MQPQPMNEFIQANLSVIGIDINFEVVDFVSLFAAYRSGAKSPVCAGISAINLAMPTQEPTSAMLRSFLSENAPPRGNNRDFYSDAKIDQALHFAQESFEPRQFDEAFARVHERLVDQAAFLFVVHDTNPRALSQRIEGFIQPHNWFADFTTISIK